ncbi:glycosyltransferase family 1 [Opitutaceae bacterium TAV5]|nr:glycosyltransferase family 1 [Opitutaceae bacterium TAV5]
MKRLLLLLTLGATCASAETLLVSDFSGFTAGYYTEAFDGPWSEATALSGATDFTIGDFGSGTPSGAAGNGFIQELASGPQDWSGYVTLSLTGFASLTNGTDQLFFRAEDINGDASLVAAFDLSLFADGATTVSVSLDFTGLDATQIAYWGFVVNDFDAAPEFGFTFDHLELSTAPIPEPATTVALAGAGVLMAAFAARRFRRRA